MRYLLEHFLESKRPQCRRRLFPGGQTGRQAESAAAAIRARPEGCSASEAV
jgi:hypothetical protein